MCWKNKNNQSSLNFKLYCALLSQALEPLLLMSLLPKFPGTRSGTRTWSRKMCCRPWRRGLTSTATSPAPSTCANSTTGRATTSKTCCSPATTVGLSAALKTSKWWVGVRRRFCKRPLQGCSSVCHKRSVVAAPIPVVCWGDLMNVSLRWCRDYDETIWLTANVSLTAAWCTIDSSQVQIWDFLFSFFFL